MGKLRQAQHDGSGRMQQSLVLPLMEVQGTLGFPEGTAVKNLPAMQEAQETQVPSLGQEDPLE